MLSRTADSLYWMARYMERAGNLARILEVADRMALSPTPESVAAPSNSEWRSALIISGTERAYSQKYSDVTPAQVLHFLALDETNPSSIRSCIETARRNGRSMRTALTREVWENLNDTWLEVRGATPQRLAGSHVRGFLDWARERSLQFHGAATGTMLRDDTYAFTRLGTFVERGDNTARILDVKYHILLPEYAPVGGGRDYYQWAAILRAVSAHRSYRYIYRDSYKPWLIADLLILREEMPRSMTACLGQIVQHLGTLAERYGQRHECHRLAGQLYSEMRFAKISEVFQDGLHEFLSDFISRNMELSDQIRTDFLM